MTDRRALISVLFLTTIFVTAGCPRPTVTSSETLAEFRRMTTQLLSSSGNFAGAGRYLRNTDFIGETAVVGPCASFQAQEEDLRLRLEHIQFVVDIAPSYLPQEQLPICRAYRRERNCTQAGCEYTDALQICLHTDPQLDQCKFTRATWAATFRGPDANNAVVVDDDDFKREARDLIEAATAARRPHTR